MGEVRAKVKLTNATDEDLAADGRISRDAIRSYEADAMVDTGAVNMVLPIDVVRRLGVKIPRSKVVEYADGRKEPVGLTGGVLINIDGRETVDDALVLGDEVLVGQTVLEKLDLVVDCTNHRLIPNPAHPDQAVVKVK